MTPQARDRDGRGSPERDPGVYEGVVRSLLDLQRRLRGNAEDAGSNPPVIGRPARADDLVVVDDVDLSLELGPGSKTGDDADPDLVGADRIWALTARVRRIETDLSGVYETVGRLAEELDDLRDATSGSDPGARGDAD